MKKTILLVAILSFALPFGAETSTISKIWDFGGDETFLGMPSTIKRAAATYDPFKAHCQAYGFSINDNWAPVYMSDFMDYAYTCKERDEVNYEIDIDQVFLKNVYANDTYAFAYRVVISPRQVRHFGFLGIDSYGDNWYVSGLKTTVNLRQYHHLTDWAPENNPQRTTGSIGIGLDSTGPSISALVNFEANELTVQSESSVAESKYLTKYSVTGTGTYAANAIKFYGFYTFIVESGHPAWVDVTHECGLYGSAWYHERTETYSNTY
ncbi:MAG: hypothetical protein LKE31_01440 [Bacilli bacterium]|jgi:hypothetical protein|nr:hypothetical protein [Bacilli bacterium]